MIGALFVIGFFGGFVLGLALPVYDFFERRVSWRNVAILACWPLFIMAMAMVVPS